MGRQSNKTEIQKAYCNAHARRKFKESGEESDETISFFIDKYREIYLLEAQCKGKDPEDTKAIRVGMIIYFEQMKTKAIECRGSYSSKSEIAKACAYFLKNYEGLTLFIKNPDIPIDNNVQERHLKSPVEGRKTWCETHSKRGAETAAKLFTLGESCKVNKVNPRQYFKTLVQEILEGKTPSPPFEFKQRPEISDTG